MLNIVETERSTFEVYDHDLPVARMYWMGENMKVHMYKDNCEFETESIDTATRLIRIRWERPEWN